MSDLERQHRYKRIDTVQKHNLKLLNENTNLKSDLAAERKKNEELQRNAMALATLLDEIISHIPFDAWPHVNKELAKEGHTPDYLKALRDKYADRYRNI
jgi:hypothetical protein